MTKTTSKIDKLQERKALFLDRISQIYQIPINKSEELFSKERRQSYWQTSLKSPVNAIVGARPCGWAIKAGFSGFLLTDAQLPAVRVLQQEGKAIIQNASSWLAVVNLAPKAGDHILDTCAAPGIKTTLIAELAKNEAFITANDVSPLRVARLRDTLQSFGVKNFTVLRFKAEALAYELENSLFDKILIDAPCSGEGLINLLSPDALNSWSIKNIDRLAQQQRRILKSAWRLLKPRGTLVYSTCTVAPEENELQISDFLKTHEDAELMSVFVPPSVKQGQIMPIWRHKQVSQEVQANCLRVIHQGYYEAFFIAKLRKTG